MKRLITSSILSTIVVLLSGCVTPHAYVDPQYEKASLASIQRPVQPTPVQVVVHFERNGAAYDKVDKTLQADVQQSLTKIGVFAPSASTTAGTITVTANNIADTSGAAAKGFKAGLTFGAAGQVVDDDYDFVCVYQAGGTDKSFDYHHAIHTVIGNADAPVAGVAPMKLSDAFNKVVEDVMVNFVKDLQDSGAAPKQ